MWENISGNSDIYNWNPFPESLFSYPGLTDPTPLRHLLTSIYDEYKVSMAQRNISIGITNFDTGLHLEIDQNNTIPNLIEATMCSSAVVPVFPYQNWQNTTFVDGGNTMGYDPFVAVDRCREIVDDDSQIVLDVFFLGGQVPLGKAYKPKTAFEAFYRGNEINSFQSGVMNILDVHRLYPDVKFRYIMAASKPLPWALASMNFDQKNMIKEVEIGEKDALNALLNYPNGNADVWFHDQAKSAFS